MAGTCEASQIKRIWSWISARRCHPHSTAMSPLATITPMGFLVSIACNRMLGRVWNPNSVSIFITIPSSSAPRLASSSCNVCTSAGPFTNESAKMSAFSTTKSKSLASLRVNPRTDRELSGKLMAFSLRNFLPLWSPASVILTQISEGETLVMMPLIFPSSNLTLSPGFAVSNTCSRVHVTMAGVITLPVLSNWAGLPKTDSLLRSSLSPDLRTMASSTSGSSPTVILTFLSPEPAGMATSSVPDWM